MVSFSQQIVHSTSLIHDQETASTNFTKYCIKGCFWLEAASVLNSSIK